MTSYSNVVKAGLLLIVLISIPIVSVLNQQTQTYQSQAHERGQSERERLERESKNKFSLNGYVFEDKNNNQSKDRDENGVGEVTVNITIKARKNFPESALKNPLSFTAKTDSFGYFKIEIPKNTYPNSLLFNISINPPEGYVMTTRKMQVRREVRRSYQQIIVLGIMKSAISASPTLAVSPTPLPSPTPTDLPVLTPTNIEPSSITPTLTPTTVVMSPTPIPTVCPQPPVCDGELITVNQENMLICPLYICTSYSEN